MRRLLFYVLLLFTLSSCEDDKIVIDKSQLTQGIWVHEQTNVNLGIVSKTTITFDDDGTYVRKGISGSTESIRTGTWSFGNENIIDLTGYGSCYQIPGEPPCIPQDLDFRIIQLTREFLDVEVVPNDPPPSNGSNSTIYIKRRIVFKNIKN